MAVDRVTDRDLSQLAAQVRQLKGTLGAIEERLAAIEGMLAVAGRPARAAGVDLDAAATRAATRRETDVSESAGGGTVQGVVTLVGRTLLVLGGAYFLRAMTEASVLPPVIGVAAGLVYAAVWMMAAARAREVGSATFHMLASTLITLPMLWEASFRFAVLTPPFGALLLGGFAAAGFVVAAGRRLEHLAWIVGLGAAVAAVVLGVATRGFISYSVFLTLLGVAALWLGYGFEWVLLRWPIAAFAAGMVGGVTYRGALGHDPLLAFGVQVLFFTAYLGSFAARTLFMNRSVVPFEVAQSIAVIAVGFGGAVYLTAMTGANVHALGQLAMAFGVSAYAVAFAFVERHRPARNFFFYGTLALTFVIVGAPLAIGRIGAALTFALLGVGSGVAARSFSRWTLSIHCTAYLAAAATASGLLAVSTTGLIGGAAEGWPDLSGVQAAAFAAMTACTLCRWPRTTLTVEYIERLPRLLLLMLMTWVASGALIVALAPVVVPAVPGGLDAGPLAALRTTVLAGAVFVLARIRGDERFAAGAALVYPVLALLGAKVLLEDVWRGRPSTLFVGLAVYGAALIVIPRVMRRSVAQSAQHG